LYAVVAAGYGEPKNKLVEWLRREGLWEDVTPDEANFLQTSNPSKQLLRNARWRSEALRILLWSLEAAPSLPPLYQQCDPLKLREYLPPLFGSVRQFVSLANPRDEEEIRELLESIYQAHWTIRDARINNRPISDEYDPGVVQERHYALNWSQYKLGRYQH
jgi:hypothetical protein